MEERKALERYQLAVKGKEKTEEDLKDLIDRARAIKRMEKIKQYYILGNLLTRKP